jgi:hypothetical protein
MNVSDMTSDAAAAERRYLIVGLCNLADRPDLADEMLASGRSSSQVLHHLAQLKNGAKAWAPRVAEINARMPYRGE